jgi:hypothetical protein
VSELLAVFFNKAEVRFIIIGQLSSDAVRCIKLELAQPPNFVIFVLTFCIVEIISCLYTSTQYALFGIFYRRFNVIRFANISTVKEKITEFYKGMKIFENDQ